MHIILYLLIVRDISKGARASPPGEKASLLRENPYLVQQYIQTNEIHVLDDMIHDIICMKEHCVPGIAVPSAWRLAEGRALSSFGLFLTVYGTCPIYHTGCY